MRKRKDPIDDNKSLAKIFAIANEPQRYASFKQVPDCDGFLSASTETLGHYCIYLVNRVA
jgi:hypothetical protein